MLRGMASPEDSAGNPGNDRRTVPRHLRDGENDLLSSTGAFGRRAEDARAGGARAWMLALAAAAAALALAWFFLR
jgi:hypothetical protein